MTKKLAFLLSVVMLSFVWGCFVFAWTEPSQPPPSGNVSPPLNVGPVAQTKSGDLTVQGTGSFLNNLSVGSDNWNVGGYDAPGASARVISGYYGGYGIQKLNARASAFSTIAGANPGTSFSVIMVPWDGITANLDTFCQTKINSGWHSQAAIKGNYFNQAFDGSDFFAYSTVLTSQSEFDTYKSTGTQWWIGCSTLPAWSRPTIGGYWAASGNNIYNNNTGNVGIGTTAPGAKLDVSGGLNLTDRTYTLHDSVRTFENVAHYYVGSTPTTGTIVITIGNTLNIMLEAEIVIQGYNGLTKCQVRGYTYTGSTSWHLPAATCLSSGHSGGYTVRFGKRTSDNARVILIGTTSSNWGNYPHVAVTRVTYGYPGSGSSIGNWSISMVTDESAYTSIVDVNENNGFSAYNSSFFGSTNFPSGIWNSSGNVGIGDTTPDAGLKLDVEGKVGATEYCDQNGANCKTIASLAGGSLWTASGSNIYNTNTGNVGIGTASPEGKLHISGGNLVMDNTRTLQAKNSAGTVETWMWPRWSDNVMYTNFGTGGWNIRNNASVSRVFIQDGGNVGIGTTGPGRKLDVAGNVKLGSGVSTAGDLVAITGANYNQVNITYASNAGWGLLLGHGDGTATGNYHGLNHAAVINVQNAPLHLGTNNTSRVTIDATGNVGIGTTAPTAKLEVAGDIKVSGTASFSQPVTVSNPTQDTGKQAVNVDYLNSALGGGGGSTINAHQCTADGTCETQSILSSGRIDANSAGGAGGYISSGNYGGTGQAAYFPAGLWANGSNSWIYGTVYGFNGLWYDANNTSYYLDPASTSNLNAVQAANITYGSGAGYKFVAANNPDMGFYYPGSGRLKYYYDGANTVEFAEYGLYLPRSGVTASFYTDSPIQVPSVVDRNNTSYYLDPASTSNLYGATFGQPIIVETPLASTGKWAVNVDYLNSALGGGGGSTINAHQCTADGVCETNSISASGNLTVSGSAQAIKFDGAYTPRYQTWASQGTGAGGAAIYNDNGSYRALMVVGSDQGQGYARWVRVWDSLWANSRIDAPIYYDSSNTGYYVDPASTSRLNAEVANENYTYGWFRNYDAGEGLYNQATGRHWYSIDANYWQSSAPYGVIIRNGYQGTIRGYLYGDGTNFGLLPPDGSWQVRAWNAGVELYDTTYMTSAQSNIYYDRQDTAYYIDPASTSNLYGATFGQPIIVETPLASTGKWAVNVDYLNSALGGGGGSTINAHQCTADGTCETNSITAAGNISASGNLTVSGDATVNGNQLTVNGELAVCGTAGCSHFAYNDGGGTNYIRGPLYFNNVLYDENSPGYYLDPNSTSKLNSVYLNSNLKNWSGYDLIQGGSVTDWLRINPSTSFPRIAFYGYGAFGTGGLYVGAWADAGAGNIRATNTIRADSALCIGGDCRTSWPTGGDNLGNHTATQDLNMSGKNISGVYKMNVQTIDPVYEIDGEKYATYVSDFAGGVRTETAGLVKLEILNPKSETNLNVQNSKFQTVINFDELEKGSDLWLFWQSSNKNTDDLVVILSPGFDGRVWYEKKNSKVIIHGTEQGEVSYRFTLPRRDYKDWGNLVEEQE